MDKQFSILDAIALNVLKNDLTNFCGLGSPEKIYVALVADRTDLLNEAEFAIASVIQKLG